MGVLIFLYRRPNLENTVEPETRKGLDTNTKNTHRNDVQPKVIIQSEVQ